MKEIKKVRPARSLSKPHKRFQSECFFVPCIKIILSYSAVSGLYYIRRFFRSQIVLKKYDAVIFGFLFENNR